MFQTSYIRRIKGEKQKRYYWQGHANEAKFLKQFHDHSKNGLTCKYKSVSVYESPLVESTSYNYFLDASDAELVYTLDRADSGNDSNSNDDADDALHTVPVKIKSRLSHTTFYDERDRLQANLGFNAWEDNDPYYCELEAESEEFFRWIPLCNSRFSKRFDSCWSQ